MTSSARFYPRITLLGLLAWIFSIAVAVGILSVKWRPPFNHEALFGPLLIAQQGDFAGWVLAFILLPSIFAVVLKPHPVTAVISVLAFLFWVFLGAVGPGIGC